MFRSEALVVINLLNIRSNSASMSSTTISTSSSLLIIVSTSDTSHNFSHVLKLSTRVKYLILKTGSCLRPESGLGMAMSDNSDPTINAVVALTSFSKFTTTTRLGSSGGAAKVLFIPLSEFSLFRIAFFSCFRGRRWGAKLQWSAVLAAIRRNADCRFWTWALARRRRSLAAAQESAIFRDASETWCAHFSWPWWIISSLMSGECSKLFTESCNSLSESKSKLGRDILNFLSLRTANDWNLLLSIYIW